MTEKDKYCMYGLTYKFNLKNMDSGAEDILVTVRGGAWGMSRGEQGVCVCVYMCFYVYAYTYQSVALQL